MPYFEHRGVRLWFEVTDATSPGTPRLFVNGSGSAIDDVRPLLPRFAGGRALAVLDHRGMGRSDTPDEASSMADFADDLMALLRHLEWTKVDVIGISFGGMVAQELVCRTPEPVRRLVLMCTSAGGAGGSSYPLHELMDLDDESRRLVMPRLQDSRFDEDWLRTHHGPVERLVTTASARPNTVGFRMQMEARRRHDVWTRLGGVTVPTLVASGSFDGIAPPENGRRIADRVQGSTYREYEGGHMFFLQDRSFFDDLETFLVPDPTIPGSTPNDSSSMEAR